MRDDVTGLVRLEQAGTEQRRGQFPGDVAIGAQVDPDEIDERLVCRPAWAREPRGIGSSWLASRGGVRSALAGCTPPRGARVGQREPGARAPAAASDCSLFRIPVRFVASRRRWRTCGIRCQPRHASHEMETRSPALVHPLHGVWNRGLNRSP